MNKTKLLGIVIGVLIILNGVLLYALSNKGQGKINKPPRPEEMIVSELGFDADQQAQFLDLSKEHRAFMRQSNQEMRRLRKRYFNLINQNNVDSAMVSAINNEMVSLQSDIHKKSFDHFREIRQLCRPDQLEKYGSFLDKISGRPGPPLPGPHGPKGRRGEGGPPPHEGPPPGH